MTVYYPTLNIAAMPLPMANRLTLINFTAAIETFVWGNKIGMVLYWKNVCQCFLEGLLFLGPQYNIKEVFYLQSVIKI